MSTDICLISSPETLQIYDAESLCLRGTFALHLSDKRNDKNPILFALAGNDDHLVSTSGPFWFAHSFTKEQPLYRTVLKNELSAIAADKEGMFYAGGTRTGEFSIWDASTGECLRSLSSHYKRITAIEFIEDFVVTVSEDSIIHIWQLGDLLDESMRHVVPYKSIMEHTSSITGLYGYSGRFVTCSLDKSCRIRDMITGKLLLTLFIPAPVSCVVINPQETLLFAGCDNGDIYRINIFPSQTIASGIVNAGDGELTHKFTSGSSAAVSTLRLSTDSTLLYSVTSDATLYKWDVLSGQKVSSTSISKTKITGSTFCMEVIVKPSNLFSVTSWDKDVASQPPQRTGTIPGSRISAHIVLKSKARTTTMHPQVIVQSTDDSSAAEIEKLKEDNKRLQTLFKNAQTINDEMYAYIAKQDAVGK